MTESRQGAVLLLIGPSSVGKTSIARELQRVLPRRWLLAGVDMFWGMVDERTLPAGGFRADSEEMRRITRGWHRSVAALAAEGNNVLVDELWTHRWWLEDWREVLNGFQWWSVMLTASPVALAARESLRGDRPEGLAAGDSVRPPDSSLFDLTLDTTNMTAADCATAIAGLIARPKSRDHSRLTHDQGAKDVG